jgi:Baseplate J-like protein
MALKPANLDDRTFDQLLEEARARIAVACPQWTDRSPSDPGIVLLELFAYLTETMIYRLNRLPEKAYVEFLRLMGVKLIPPAASSVALSFSVSRPAESPVEIPRGTRVTLGRSTTSEPAPVFVTIKSATIPTGKSEIETTAFNCELVEAELAAVATGEAGFSVTVQRPPIVAEEGEALELIVGIEAAPEELTGRVRALEHDGKAFLVWREVENFTNLPDPRTVYVVDRVAGTITFAPAAQMKGANGDLNELPQALGETPRAGREIRLWYCRGGGQTGNVAAGTLTTLKDPIPGVSVTNPRPASGGRAVETLQNAISRGPQEFHSLQRAVTASDFELLALRSSGAVARARAFTKARIWVHAPPGTIEVMLVPAIPPESRPGGVVTEEILREQQNDDVLQRIQVSLDERRPLGTQCLVGWVRYKNVRVRARAVIHSGEDASAVRSRVLQRLHQSINPLPSDLPSAGWPFGQPLRASHIYDIILAEPGVNYVDNVRLLVDEVPEANVRALAADAFQPDTWYAAAGSTLFRSVDDADGWERIGIFPDEEVRAVRVSTQRAGMVAIVTHLIDDSGRVYVSEDCGENWREVAHTAFAINDLAWTARETLPLLMLATDQGLFELALQAQASPVQVQVDPGKPTLGFYAVAASVGIRGTFFVATAARGAGGVFLSSQGGRQGTFTLLGLSGDDVRVLEVQQDGVRTFLWAGITVAGNEAGKGCVRWELQGATPPTTRTLVNKQWDGGSCHALAFKGSLVFAATHQKGVLWLDQSKGDDASWHLPVLGCGLPVRDVERIFHPVLTVAADPAQQLVLAGGPVGVYCSADDGTNYENCSSREFRDKVTLPGTWLFCSGEHSVEVLSEDEANRD